MTTSHTTTEIPAHTAEELAYLASIWRSPEDREIEAELLDDIKESVDAFTKRVSFNRHYWCENTYFNSTAERLSAELNLPSSYKPSVVLAVVKIVLVNLTASYNRFGSDYWITYSRDKNRIDIHKRYRKSGLSHKYLIAILDRMHGLRLIRNRKGYYDRLRIAGRNKSHAARMKPAPRLIDNYLGSFPLAFNDLAPYPKQEFIELRKSGSKRAIDYLDTLKRRQQRKVLVDYNTLLHSTLIDHADFETSVELSWASKIVRRIFNNSDFEQGGRFYGGWWQTIKRNLRQGITINGNPCVELDFKALHPLMLYQINGVAWAHDFDPYTLPQYNNHSVDEKKKIRNLCKAMVLIWVNADNLNQAQYVLDKAIRFDRVSGENRFLHGDDAPELQSVVENFKIHNAAIVDNLFTGIGIELQYRDSCIAEYIIKRMTEQNRVVLSIHDGFICEAQYEEELRVLMAEGYRQVMNTTQVPAIEKEWG